MKVSLPTFMPNQMRMFNLCGYMQSDHVSILNVCHQNGQK